MIENDITIGIFPDPDYNYRVTASDCELFIAYDETDKDVARMAFGSLDEMEAVAKAMLRVIMIRKEMGGT